MKPLIVALAVLWSLTVEAQAVITGEIHDANGNQVSYATVTYRIDTLHPVAFFCIADKEGKFRLPLPSEVSKGLLQVSAVGFLTKTIAVDPSVAKLHLEVILAKQDHQLPPLYVKGDNAIQVSGDTISYRAERFKRGNEHSLANLLANMPGFHVEGGRISFNGLPIDRILIQGDDLTGSNYELLVRKLGIDGIDKLQVIRNYKDPASLLSKLSSSSRQVLNINFRNNYLNRVFGSVAAAGGLPSASYDADDQVLGLTNKVKLLNFQTINNTGDAHTAGDVTGLFHEKGPDGNDPFNDLDLAARASLASIPDNDNILQLPRNFTSNNTAQSAIDVYVRPNKTFTVKGRFNGLWDRHNEQDNTMEQYFLPNQTVGIQENRSVTKKNRLLNNDLFLNWMMTPKEQLAIILKADDGKVHDGGNSLLQDNDYSQSDQYRDHRYGGKLIYNHLLGNQGQSALSFDLQYSYQRLPGNFSLRPSNYSSFFFKPVAISDMGQQELQHHWELIPHAMYLGKSVNNRFSIELTGNAGGNNLTTGISGNDNSLHVKNDSVNDFNVDRRQIGLKVQDEWNSTRWMTLTFNVDGQYQRYNFGGSSPFSNPFYRQFVVLPAIFAQFTLSSKDRLNLSAALENHIPDIAEIAPGYTILRLTAISKGSGSFSTRTYPTAQLLFSHVAVAQQGLLIFAGVNFSRMPYLNLPDVIPNPSYSYSAYTPTEKAGTNFSLFTRADWFLPQLHLRFTPDLTLRAGRGYTILSGAGFYTRYLQWKTGLAADFTVEKFQIGGESAYYLSHQDRDLETPVKASIQWRNKLKLSWKLKQGLFLDADALYDVIYPPGQRGQDILLTDAELMYHFPGEHWTVGLQGQNLLDKRSFSQYVISPSSSIYSTYSLLHRVTLAYVRFSF